MAEKALDLAMAYVHNHDDDYHEKRNNKSINEHRVRDFGAVGVSLLWVQRVDKSQNRVVPRQRQRERKSARREGFRVEYGSRGVLTRHHRERMVCRGGKEWPRCIDALKKGTARNRR